ncbi:hypothetical protein V8G54_031923 [Vigna mungo]|uniref:Uncharacterized protein n=1 Tax=Vigna mungo TaxID=3915 RepID=A0AAQ3ML01_VIGMU
METHAYKGDARVQWRRTRSRETRPEHKCNVSIVRVRLPSLVSLVCVGLPCTRASPLYACDSLVSLKKDEFSFPTMRKLYLEDMPSFFFGQHSTFVDFEVSQFCNKQWEDDQDYGATEFKSEECMEWLDDKPKGSVVYVSFGSVASFRDKQMEEIACCLRECSSYFLWVVGTAEETKLPKHFEKKNREVW